MVALCCCSLWRHPLFVLIACLHSVVALCVCSLWHHPPFIIITVCMFVLSGRTLRLQFMTPPTVHNNYCLHVYTQWSHSASAVYDATHCSYKLLFACLHSVVALCSWSLWRLSLLVRITAWLFNSCLSVIVYMFAFSGDPLWLRFVDNSSHSSQRPLLACLDFVVALSGCTMWL